MKRRLKITLMFLLIWVALIGIGYGVASYIFDSEQTELWHLIKDGKPIWGKVVAKERENHATIRYTYIIDGTSYSGQGGSGRGNPGFDDMNIGDNVIVYYDPTNPAESFVGYPHYQLQANHSVTVFTSLAFGIVPMIFILATYFGIGAAKKSRSQ